MATSSAPYFCYYIRRCTRSAVWLYAMAYNLNAELACSVKAEAVRYCVDLKARVGLKTDGSVFKARSKEARR